MDQGQKDQTKRLKLIRRIATAGAVLAVPVIAAGRLEAQPVGSGTPGPAPEPGTIILTGVGLAAAVGVALRKRKQGQDDAKNE